MKVARLELIEPNVASIKVLQVADLDEDPVARLGQQVVQVVVPFIEVFGISQDDLDDEERRLAILLLAFLACVLFVVAVDAVDDAKHVLGLDALRACVYRQDEVVRCDLGDLFFFV